MLGGNSLGLDLGGENGSEQSVSIAEIIDIAEGVGDSTARFANQNGAANIAALRDFKEVSEVLVVSFVAAANDKDNVTIRESLDGDTGGADIGGEIIIVVVDMVKRAKKLKAVGEALGVREAFFNGFLVLAKIPDGRHAVETSDSSQGGNSIIIVMLAR